MSKDADGHVFTYWPITGLVEGENSEVLTFSEQTPSTNGFLRSTGNDVVNVWARRKGVGASYQNIVTTPIDLSGMPAGDTEFEIYLECIGPIPDGMEIVTLYVTASFARAAGWTT